MEITDVEAIAMVWPSPERQFWTALRPAGGFSELIVRIHTCLLYTSDAADE